MGRDNEELKKSIAEIVRKSNEESRKREDYSNQMLELSDGFDQWFPNFINSDSESRKIRSDITNYSKIEEKEKEDFENFSDNFKNIKNEDEQIDWLIKIVTSSDTAPGFYSYLAHDEKYLRETIIKLTSSEEFYKKFINKMNRVKEEEYENIIAEIYPNNKDMMELMIAEIKLKNIPLNEVKDFLLNDLVNDEVTALTMSFISDITKINCIKSKFQNSGKYNAKKEVLRCINDFIKLYNMSSAIKKSKIIAFLNLASKEIYYLNNIDITKIFLNEHPDINKLTSDLSNIDLSSKTTTEFTGFFSRERSTSFIDSLSSFSNKYYKDNNEIKDLLNEIKKIYEKDYKDITTTDMKVGKFYHVEDPVSLFMENMVDLTIAFTLLRSDGNTNLQYPQLLELNNKIDEYNKIIDSYEKSKIFKGPKKKYEEAIKFKGQLSNYKEEFLESIVKNNIRQVYDEKTKKLLDIYNNADGRSQMLIIQEIENFLMKYDGIFSDHINKYTQEEKNAFRDYIDNCRFEKTTSLYLGEQGKKDFRKVYEFRAQAYSFAIWEAYSNLLEEMINELPKNGMDYSYFQSYFDELLSRYISRNSLNRYQEDSIKAVYRYLDDSKDISIEFSDMYSNLRNELISASNNNINDTEKGISK